MAQEFQAGITFVVTDFQATNRQLGSLSGQIARFEGDVNRAASGTSAAMGGVVSPSIASASAELTKLGAAVGIVGGLLTREFFEMAKEASNFDQQLRLVQKISSATAQELGLLKNAAIQAGLATQFSPQEAVEGLRVLAQQGLNSRDSIAALIPALNLAQVSLGELGVSDAAFLASQAMNGFGAKIDEVPLKMDVLAKATNTFALSMKELPLGMGIVARGSQAMNQTLEESVIAFGLIKNVIPTVERAASSAAVTMERLTESKRQDMLMSKFQVKAVDEATGKFRPFLDVINDIAVASKDMTDAEKSAALGKIFGSRAAGGLNALLTQLTNGVKTTTGEVLKGADAIAYLRDRMKNAAGTTEEMSDALMNTLAGQLTLLQGVRQTMRTVFGDALAQAFKPVFKILVSVLTAVTTRFETLPHVVKMVVGWIAILGSGFMTAVGAALTMVGAVAGLSLISGALVVALKVTALAIGAVIQIMAPFILMAAVAYAAYKTNFAGIATFVNQVVVGFQALIEIVGNYQSGMTTMSEETSNALMEAGIFDFVVGLGGALGRMKQYAIDVFEYLVSQGPAIKSTLMPAFEGLEIIFTSLLSVGQTVFGALFGQVIPSSFDGSVKSIDGFKAGFEAMLPQIKQGAEDVKVFAQDFKAGLERAKPTILFFAGLVKFLAQHLWDIGGAFVAALANVGLDVWTTLSGLFTELYNTGLILWGALGQVGGAFNEIFNALSGIFPSLRNTTSEFSGLSAVVFALTAPLKLLAGAFKVFAFFVETAAWIVGGLITVFRVGFEGAGRVVVATLNVVGGTIDYLIGRVKALALALSGDLAGASRELETSNALMMDGLRRAGEEFTRPLPDNLFGPPGDSSGGQSLMSSPGDGQMSMMPPGQGSAIQSSMPNLNVSMPGFEMMTSTQTEQSQELREINRGIQELVSRSGGPGGEGGSSGYGQYMSGG